MGDAPYSAPDEPAAFALGNTTAAARDLWLALDAAYAQPSSAAWQRSYRTLAYRAAATEQSPDWLLGRWRWRLALWTDADRQQFTATMGRAALEREKAQAQAKELEKSIKVSDLLKANPELKKLLPKVDKDMTLDELRKLLEGQSPKK
jgi:hypothetical protein